MRSNTGVRKPAARKLSARKPAKKAVVAKKPATAAKKAAAGVRKRSAKSGSFTPIRGHTRAESSARAELSGLLERINRTIDETEALLAD
ncbi:MAG: hypothetical protein AVDCRST_MAG08-2129 [uncultured Acetobacteraceae bacterium]|uniref:Uncharacterized protein n=1 Tax=uncultured Acetobacteraceae bacterium TaxID=169975 RepID=A0A6J4IE65_9PROT|nr:MAG: hypothetical protein AVDCRST_MAG08-2129 [uncultured Acetobacteraceae bacterium]